MHATVLRDPRSRSMGSKGFLAIARHPPPSRIFHRYSDLEVCRTPTINEPSHRVTSDPGHRRWYCSSPSHHGTSSNTQDKWPKVGRCRTRSWKPSPSNGGGAKVRHEPWQMKGVATLSLSLMLRDLEGGEGRGERLSAPRPGLNRPTLKMHLDSMQLRCVI